MLIKISTDKIYTAEELDRKYMFIGAQWGSGKYRLCRVSSSGGIPQYNWVRGVGVLGEVLLSRLDQIKKANTASYDLYVFETEQELLRWETE